MVCAMMNMLLDGEEQEHGEREEDSGSIGRRMWYGRPGKLCGVAEPKS